MGVSGKHHKRVGGVLLALVLFSFTGCGINTDTAVWEKTDDDMTPTDENMIVVGVSQIGSESVWRTANTLSIQSSFTKENGYFLIFDNARQKQENQIKAIRSFISQQVDYIVFSPIVESGWETVLQEAKDAEIPVILMDRRIEAEDEELFTAWVGSDFNEEGKKAGKWLEEYLASEKKTDEEINIVVLKGTDGATSVIGRTDGFDEIAAEHPNWHILAESNAEYTTAKGYEIMKGMLKTYPDIDVLVSQNDDMTFGALDAMEESGQTKGKSGEETIVISFDAVRSALAMVQNGRISVDIECNPVQGPYIEDIIQKLEKGETVEKYNYIDEKVFTGQNVDDFISDRTY